MSFAIPESQRDSIIQPRVGESASLPGVMRFSFPQPQRGCITPASKRCNPVGVENILNERPRVASRTRQPWAELHYPVGVRRAATSSSTIGTGGGIILTRTAFVRPGAAY